MALSGVVSEIFSVEKYLDLEIPVKGQSRSLKVVPFDRLSMVQCQQRVSITWYSENDGRLDPPSCGNYLWHFEISESWQYSYVTHCRGRQWRYVSADIAASILWPRSAAGLDCFTSLLWGTNAIRKTKMSACNYAVALPIRKSRCYFAGDSYIFSFPDQIVYWIGKSG